MTAAFDSAARSVAKTSFIPWDKLEGKTVAVTGATGLIGRTIVESLLARNEMRDSAAAEIHVLSLVRNVHRAHELFGDRARIVFWDASDGLIPDEHVDFIVHCAAPTGSKFFVERPVDTIEAVVRGTGSMLKLAMRDNARLCLLSTMEVYGSGSDETLAESAGGAMDSMVVRNSYPEAKQLAESLCAAYAAQYNTQVCVARLAQTFGPGVAPDDGRVFAEFARCATQGRDIVLLTDGSKRNSYLSTLDATTAALLLVTTGGAGEAYNVANAATFTSILDMAAMVAEEFGNGACKVRVDIDPEAAKRFRPGNVLKLDTSKLETLGWKPVLGLSDMYGSVIEDWAEGQ